MRRREFITRSIAKMEATRIEIVVAFLVVCVVIVWSFVIVRHADLGAIGEPSVRRLIRHAYAGLGFELIALLMLATCLLPTTIQEKYLYTTRRLNRPALYFVVLWCLLVMLGV
ncbi:MAG: hypothetical protein ACJ8D7_00680, partial [Xanthobacteraceae bacterium]